MDFGLKLSHVTMNPEKNVKMYTMTSGIKLIAIFKHQYLTFIEKNQASLKSEHVELNGACQMTPKLDYALFW